jgi:hypothetical protein
MLRFLLFTGDTYEERGGLNDMKGRYSTLKDVAIYALEWRCDWWHILDVETGDEYNNDSHDLKDLI